VLTIANNSAILRAVMSTQPQTFAFTLLIDGPDLQDDDRLNALFEGGCDDATFGRRDSIQFADFDREAPSLAEAIHTAIRNIMSVVPEATVIRVEPEEFVSQQAIAERIGISKEYVRLLATGERGPGSFPSVVRWVDAKTRLWLWSDVAEWFEAKLGKSVSPKDSAHTVAAFNGLLEIRRHMPCLLEAGERDQVVEFFQEDEELRVLLGV
jgi:hypothetical protein